MAQILYGKPVAEKIDRQTKNLIEENELSPKLCIVLSENDKSVITYTRTLQKKAELLGISTEIIKLSSSISQDEANKTVDRLSKKSNVDGIIIQSPINNLDINFLRMYLGSYKDVDGTTDISLGRLVKGNPVFVPATPQAVIEMLIHYEIVMSKKNIVILGRGTVVGKPLAHLLLEQDATVTVCHSKTPDISEHTKNADIVIGAVGKPNLIKGEMLKKEAVVIDVGTSFLDGKMAGDSDFESVGKVASAVSPVPGGVGPVTASVLLSQVAKSAKLKLILDN
jgi:methylenetetrahydrofolate dehydrogenase (NADP+)/methenyltetrahydrofolate cyclohydrolase